jgi:MFS transporter, YNFM family, putative membrane transport protein
MDDASRTTEMGPSMTGQAVAEEGGAGGLIATLVALFITGFGSFLNLYVTQPLLPEFRHIFHASEILVSLSVSAPVFAVALTAPLVGLLSDGVGRKRVIIASMLGLALPTALAATAANLGQLIVWRFLTGLFMPGVTAVAVAYVGEESPAESAGLTMGTYVTGMAIGGFAGRFLAGLFATWWGWRVAFLCLGVITVAAALTAWWLLPRSTKFVRQSNVAAALKSMRGHLRNPQLLATYAVGFSLLFCLVATFTYVNFYLADKPFFLGPAALASIFAVYLIGAVITPVTGHIMDRVGHRKMLMGAIAVSGTGLLLTLIHSMPFIIVGLALMAGGVFTSQSAALSHLGRATNEARSSASGLYVSLYYLGGFVGSVLPGFLWRWAGWPGCVVIVLCIQGLTILITGKLWHDV